MTAKNDLPSLHAKPAQGQTHDERVAGALRSSMIWNLANAIVSQAVVIGVFIFLTWKLDPVVFGIFALAVVFVDYFSVQYRSALLDTTLQCNRFDQRSLSTIFLTVLAVFTVIALLLSAGSFGLSLWFGEPMLKLVVPALAFLLIPIGFALPGEALLMRNHDFRGFAVRNMSSALVGAACAAGVALSAFPEWALFAQRLGQHVANNIFVLLRSAWRPSLHFDRAFSWKFLRHSLPIFSAQALASSQSRVLDVIVATAFGTAAVGILRVASRLMEAIYGAFASPISSLWVILLSEGEKTDEERQSIYVRLSQMSALVCVPIFAGFALVSNELVQLALGAKYQNAGPILCLFGIAGLFAPLAYFRNAGFIALKRFRLLMMMSIVDVLIVVLVSLAAWKVSLMWVVGSLILVEASRALISARVMTKAMATPWQKLLASIAPAYFASLAMAVALYAVHPFTDHLALWARFTVKAAFGASVYVAYLALFHKNWSLEALNILLRRRVTLSDTPAL